MKQTLQSRCALSEMPGPPGTIRRGFTAGRRDICDWQERRATAPLLAVEPVSLNLNCMLLPVHDVVSNLRKRRRRLP